MASTAAEALLRDGHLEEALGQLKDAVRKNAADPKLRTFLFQALAVQGDWERALNQLQVVGEMDASTLPMVQTYREAIRCELLRQRVFSGQSTPLAFGEPKVWFALLVEALRLDSLGEYGQSGQLRAQAFEDAPAASGTIDAEPFGWIADADMRLGPVLEVIMQGRYYWMPFESLQQVDIDPPADLRDVVWLPAHLIFRNGGDSVALIPTRYPGSAEVPDPMLKLSRRTEWVEMEGGLFTGLGQRTLATDRGEFPLMDARELVFSAGAAG